MNFCSKDLVKKNIFDVKWVSSERKVGLEARNDQFRRKITNFVISFQNWAEIFKIFVDMKFLSESLPFPRKSYNDIHQFCLSFIENIHFELKITKNDLQKNILFRNFWMKFVVFEIQNRSILKMYIMILTNELRLFSEYFVWFSSI